MSNNVSAKRTTTLLFAFVVSIALVAADLIVLAQDQDEQSRGAMIVNKNTNTQSESTTTNTSSRRRGTRRNRRNRRSRSSSASTDTSAEAGGTTSILEDSGERSPGEQTDLSGTYTGAINFPDGSLEGDGTLTINGNQFTLTSGSESKSGRLTAVKTRGYTGVAMQFDGVSPTTTSGTPYIVSARAIKRGDNLTLTNVEGSDRIFTFGSHGSSSVGNRAARVRRGRRRKAPAHTMENTNTNTSTP